MPSNTVLSKGKALGDSTLDFLNSNNYLNSLGLVQVSWQRGGQDPSSSYPANPYLQCPRLWLRLYTGNTVPGAPQAGQKTSAKYNYSLYYYRRQVQGEGSHHEIMVANTEIIVSTFTGISFWPINMTAVDGLSFKNGFEQFQTIYHPQIPHPSGDPNLVVDVAEMNYVVDCWLTPSS